jgi:hypothetical protein
MRTHILSLFALALLGMLSGCQAPERAVEQRYETLSGEFEAQLNAQATATPLHWDEAVERMMAQNLDIQRSYNGILDAREATQRVFLDLVPPVNLSARLSRQLTDLGNLSSDDLDFSVFSTVNVPGVIRLRVNHYAALLQEIRATWAFELERRERTAQLYALFIRQRNLEQRARTLELSGLSLKNQPLKSIDPANPRPAELERRNRLWALDREREQLGLDVARLLGDYSALWIPEPESLPTLYPNQQLPDIHELEQIAVLWRQLRAAELEGARMTELGAQLNYWPDLRMTISSPPLFQSQGGQTFDWDKDAVNFSLSSSLSIDTQMRNAFRLRQIRRGNALILKSLEQESAEIIRRLKEGLATWQFNQDELLLTETRHRLLLKSLATGSLDTANDRLESLLRVEEQLTRLRSEQAELEALFWRLDEAQWQRKDFDQLLTEARARANPVSLN